MAVVAVLVGGGPWHPARAVSFACGRTTSEMQRLDCADPALGARDEILAKLYAAARVKDAGGRVRAGQRAWLEAAEACRTVACLAAAYDGRIRDLRDAAGAGTAATDFFSDEPEGNHATLSVVGPVGGFASVSLTATYVGAGGEEAGDVYAARTDAFIDLRHGPATRTVDGCSVTYRQLDADRWQVGQSGPCDLPGGTAYAGIYRR